MNIRGVREGQKHATATVFLVTRELPKRVLLMDHKKMGVWMPPGGHLESTENPYQTAIRETFEESGIDVADYLPVPTKVDQVAISLPVPKYIFEEKIFANGDQPEHFHLDHIYVVEVPFQNPINAKTESHSIRWFEIDEIENIPILENVAMIVREILSNNS